jgi:hypothetical protein
MSEWRIVRPAPWEKEEEKVEPPSIEWGEIRMLNEKWGMNLQEIWRWHNPPEISLQFVVVSAEEYSAVTIKLMEEAGRKFDKKLSRVKEYFQGKYKRCTR